MTRNLPATLLVCVLVIVAGLALLAAMLDRPTGGQQVAPSQFLPAICDRARACIPAEEVPFTVVRS